MPQKIVLMMILLVAAASLSASQSSATTSAAYSMSDLLPNVNGLLTSNASDAYFIIGIVGTPDFIQLYGSEGTAFLDFPMITPRQ